MLVLYCINVVSYHTEVQQSKLSIRKSVGQLLGRDHALLSNRSDSPILGERFTPQRPKGMKHSHTTGSLQVQAHLVCGGFLNMHCLNTIVSCSYH